MNSLTEKIKELENQLEKAEIYFNQLNREAKYYKIQTLQPMQRELNELLRQWANEKK
jgi:3-methyladenine DNA glycosylase AlkD